MAPANSKTQIYSRQGLWSLFLMCAFPLHLWTLILALRDLSWLIERSNLWDAISVASYGMIFAFVESVMVFVVVSLLGFLISKHWSDGQRVALLSSLVLITALWAISGQLSFLLNIAPPEWMIRFLAQQKHPLRVLYTGEFALVAFTFIIPTYFILKSEKALKSMLDFIDRLSLLATFYLFFDVIGLMIVIIRNV